MIIITNRWTSKTLYDAPKAQTAKEAIEAAVKAGAVLADANLAGADLADADLSRAEQDLSVVLDSVPDEVAGLREALIGGRVNGQVYEGVCACLVGTIANLRHCAYTSMPDLLPDSNRPIERLFLAIRTGDTPETNPVSAIVVGWIDAWMAAHDEVER